MLDKLKDVVSPKVKIPFSVDTGVLCFKEKATESVIKELKITSVPEHSVAFSLDYDPTDKALKNAYQQLSCYLNKENGVGINKGCDLVIMSKVKERYVALILDVKSNKPSAKATAKQLANSELFVRYMLSMIGCHYKIELPPISYKRIIIKTSGPSKAPTFMPHSPRKQSNNFISVTVECKKGNAQKHFMGLASVGE